MLRETTFWEHSQFVDAKCGCYSTKNISNFFFQNGSFLHSVQSVLIHHFLAGKVILNAVSAISHFVLSTVKLCGKKCGQLYKNLLIWLFLCTARNKCFFIARNERVFPSCLSAHINWDTGPLRKFPTNTAAVSHWDRTTIFTWISMVIFEWKEETLLPSASFFKHIRPLQNKHSPSVTSAALTTNNREVFMISIFAKHVWGGGGQSKQNFTCSPKYKHQINMPVSQITIEFKLVGAGLDGWPSTMSQKKQF